MSHVTSNERPVWFIKGIHHIQGPGEAQQRVFMFGRVRSTAGSGLMSCLQPTQEASKDHCESRSLTST